MTALLLAKPIPPVPSGMTCTEVYDLMASDESLFALAVVSDDVPIGLIGRVALMSQFARVYWREVYAHRPITKLMDPAPVIVDVATPVELIGLRFVQAKHTVSDVAFVVACDGRYHGLGSTIDLLQSIAHNAQQRAQELSAAHRDIQLLNEQLERRVAERTEELRAAHAKIIPKERLAAIGQLTATVAHELRNPLSSIRNTLFTIREALGDRAPALERPVARMERSIARCDGIINELLDYTRTRELQRRPIAMDPWLDDLLAELTSVQGIILDRQLGAPGCRAHIDAERMRRVVVNLIENAVHALADVSGERRITIGSRVALDTYELTITDNGPGIPADILPKVFEPLFSTKSFGTGLGLPLVKQIIEQHGGSVALAAVAPSGTRAVIRLTGLASEEIAAA